MSAHFFVLGLVAWVSACSAAPKRPAGPPPEYENRPVIPWPSVASASVALPFSVAPNGTLPAASHEAVLSNDAGVQ